MNTDTGIYKITSPSGKFYIGSAVSFRRRWYKHLFDLRHGVHHSVSLQSAYNKYGESLLRFDKIALCAVTELIAIEQRFIDQLQPAYNCSPTAGSILGMKRGPCSDETRRKIGDANRGRTPSAETRLRISKSNLGKKRSEDFCKKNGDWHRGKTIPPEMRARISESLRGERHPNFGKPLTKEKHERLLAGIRKPVICVDTGITFESGRAAADWLRSNGYPTARNSHISSVCKGKLRRAYGYAWRFA